MTQFPSFYNGSLILPWPEQASTSYFVCGTTSSSSTEAKALASLRSHSQAERRRRERINAHLSTLRSLIPNGSKMDKASLLAAVADLVKDLHRRASEIGEEFTIPTDVDEVTVECDENGNCNSNKNDNDDSSSINKERITIRASMCCNDRPELFADLSQALDGLKLRTIRADMATLGGRVKFVLILCPKGSEENVCLTSLKDSLKAVLDRVAFSIMS
ncbi:transcription factor bHLH30-like [Magnolia sinica]|uniref:transcription factor bHLH30-like n=1 Tax=Magnolia sinica TaxID=86752 RepID=UPI002658355B|nr:transcription factor bHLH30-like [Magnolia sinica]